MDFRTWSATYSNPVMTPALGAIGLILRPIFHVSFGFVFHQTIQDGGWCRRGFRGL